MTKLETSKTLTVLCLALLIAQALFDTKWLLWLAIALTLGNACDSRITTSIAGYWMRFAAFIGNINSKIILFLLFYLVLTPIAFLYRIFNRDQVEHFRKNRQQTYFEDIKKNYGRKDFENLW